MKNLFLMLILTALYTFSLNAKNIENDISKKADITKKHLQEQMQREQRYAKEQKFYQAKDYNLSEVEVDQSDLDAIPMIEPENDFDMTDVYRDDI